jgi:hypothetical protein
VSELTLNMFKSKRLKPWNYLFDSMLNWRGRHITPAEHAAAVPPVSHPFAHGNNKELIGI